MMQLKNDLERKLFAIAVEGLDDRYDPAVRMIWEYRGKHGYHSRLSDCMVHPVRGSFHYAQALLNRDGEGDRARAHDLLYRVIPLQDINPARDTYGNHLDRTYICLIECPLSAISLITGIIFLSPYL